MKASSALSFPFRIGQIVKCKKSSSPYLSVYLIETVSGQTHYHLLTSTGHMVPFVNAEDLTVHPRYSTPERLDVGYIRLLASLIDKGLTYRAIAELAAPSKSQLPEFAFSYAHALHEVSSQEDYDPGKVGESENAIGSVSIIELTAWMQEHASGQEQKVYNALRGEEEKKAYAIDRCGWKLSTHSG